MTNVLRFGFFLWGLTLFSPVLSGQVRVSEKDVQLEQLFIEANLEKMLGNYDKAITQYEEILKKDRKNHAAAYEIGRIYDVKSDTEKAIKSIKTAIELAPANLWYRKFLADLYQKTGRNTEAAALYEEMVKIEPTNEFLYYRWAYFLVRTNDIAKALKVYDQLESRIGVNEELINRKHSLYLGMGNHKKAGQELERLIKAFPGDMQYRHLLAEFYLKIGEKAEADKVFRQILEINPEDPKASLALAAGNVKQTRSDDIAATLRPVFERSDIDIDLKIGKIMPYIEEVAQNGNPSLADQILSLTDILEQVHPGEAKSFSAAGDLLYYSGRKTEALQKYQKTLQLDDSVFLVWEQVMNIHYENQDFKNLQRVSEGAMDLFPNKGRAYFFNGAANRLLGNTGEAIDILEQALLMAGNDGLLRFDIQSELGLSFAVTEQFPKARTAFEAALQLNANSPMVLNNYSYMLAQMGQELDKAEKMSKQANQMAPNQPTFQETYGWILYRMKDYKKAKDWVQKALENGGDTNPNILEHYGDILFQLGDKDMAIEYWQKALDQGSSSKLLQKKIADRQLYE